MPETSFDFALVMPNHCNLADSVITCRTRKQFDCCFFVLPDFSLSRQPSIPSRSVCTIPKARGVVWIYRQPLRGARHTGTWARGVENEHSEAELLCVVLRGAAGAGWHPQLRDPDGLELQTLSSVTCRGLFSSCKSQRQKRGKFITSLYRDLGIRKGSP